MKIKKNDPIPNVNVFRIGSDGPEKIKLFEIISDKKVIIIGVPGAFTPTCNLEHLPGFVKNIDNFKKKNIDEVIFMSANDPFVMNEWGKKSGIKEILFIGDPFCEFGKKTDLTLDLTVIGLGLRLSRFALIIDNCIVKDLLDEEGGALDKSAAESVLNAL